MSLVKWDQKQRDQILDAMRAAVAGGYLEVSETIRREYCLAVCPKCVTQALSYERKCMVRSNGVVVPVCCDCVEFGEADGIVDGYDY